jgi:hypothetical protein
VSPGFFCPQAEFRPQLITLGCSYAFARWKTVCARHVEELALMQSYQDIKRAGMMSNVFRYDYEIIIYLYREHA